MQDPPVRTPNGDADLLSGDDAWLGTSPICPSFGEAFDYIGSDEGTPRCSNTSDNDVEDIYKRLDSFEAKLENELAELELLGVSSPSEDEKGMDPVGSGAWSTARKKKKSRSKRSKSSVSMEKLSDKTTKILSAYQTYLAEIHVENRNNASSSEDTIDYSDPALAMVHRAREDIIGSYEEKQADVEAGLTDTNAASVSLAASSNDNYTLDGGKPLQREWQYDDDGNGNVRASIFGEGIPYGRRRDRMYAQPWLRSRRNKRGVAMVALAAVALVIVGVSARYSNHGGESVANLQEFEDEYEAEKSQEAQTEEMGREAQLTTEKLEEFEAEMNSMYSGKAQAGTSSQFELEIEMEKEAKDKYYAEMKKEVPYASQVGAHISTSAMDLYAHAAEKYQPAMFDRSSGYKGTTYIDAQSFCSSMSMAVCPYEAVCPDGTDGEPLGGYRRGTIEGEWIPIADDENAWVNVEARYRCMKYSDKHGEGPEWGITGKSSGTEADVEELTRNVMCCNALKEENAKEEEASEAGDLSSNGEGPEKEIPKEVIHSIAHIDIHVQERYQEEAVKYQPKRFDRTNGYSGTTYVDAQFWCSSFSMSICPYEAICPDGTDGEPLGGYRRGVNSDWAWMPIADGHNQWVQVEAKEGCTKYSQMYGKGPEWGITGEGDEDVEGLTRNVMCCKNVM